MNEVIVGLQKKLVNMKQLIPTEAATPEQIKKYFNETEEIIEGILKVASEQETATTTEMESVREAIKDFRALIKKTDANMQPLL